MPVVAGAMVPHYGRASSIVDHYPSTISLIEAYQGCSDVEQAKELLQDVIEPGRRQKKLSARIYDVMMSIDPEEVIG